MHIQIAFPPPASYLLPALAHRPWRRLSPCLTAALASHQSQRLWVCLLHGLFRKHHVSLKLCLLFFSCPFCDCCLSFLSGSLVLYNCRLSIVSCLGICVLFFGDAKWYICRVRVEVVGITLGARRLAFTSEAFGVWLARGWCVISFRRSISDQRDRTVSNPNCPISSRLVRRYYPATPI